VNTSFQKLQVILETNSWIFDIWLKVNSSAVQIVWEVKRSITSAMASSMRGKKNNKKELIFKFSNIMFGIWNYRRIKGDDFWRLRQRAINVVKKVLRIEQQKNLVASEKIIGRGKLDSNCRTRYRGGPQNNSRLWKKNRYLASCSFRGKGLVWGVAT
jgi:uncharacterized protein YdeI (YjbR/CyaY-like superfamily)